MGIDNGFGLRQAYQVAGSIMAIMVTVIGFFVVRDLSARDAIHADLADCCSSCEANMHAQAIAFTELKAELRGLRRDIMLDRSAYGAAFGSIGRVMGGQGVAMSQPASIASAHDAGPEG